MGTQASKALFYDFRTMRWSSSLLAVGASLMLAAGAVSWRWSGWMSRMSSRLLETPSTAGPLGHESVAPSAQATESAQEDQAATAPASAPAALETTTEPVSATDASAASASR